jgi:hypothetical protein
MIGVQAAWMNPGGFPVKVPLLTVVRFTSRAFLKCLIHFGGVTEPA